MALIQIVTTSVKENHDFRTWRTKIEKTPCSEPVRLLLRNFYHSMARRVAAVHDYCLPSDK
jgi:hypothetical protein